ncbi:MAG: thiamine-monophosphate kinase [Verrucomicrobiales bacterium]|nr:thiamine-monophosphate kinase [Verrucomicrobiales bacterium]
MSKEKKNASAKAPSELELLARIKTKLPVDDSVIVGAGDDCAVIDAGIPGKWQLHKTDAVVEGVHFTREADPKKVGRKAIARALSDIAAMAGTPRWATVSLGLPDRFTGELVDMIYEGITNFAKLQEVAIVGGEMVSTPERLVMSVTVVGEVDRDKCVLRSGAKPGDGIWVTGEMGGSIAGHHLDFLPRLGEGRWLAANFLPTAMIDLSDGLAGDLGHLLDEANVGAELLEAALPIRREARVFARESNAAKPPLIAALTDGEDYELCFTLSPGKAVKMLDEFRQAFPETRISCIGKVIKESGLKIKQKDGIKEFAARGFVHFQ